MQKKYFKFILSMIVISPLAAFASTNINAACNKQQAAAVQAAIVNYLDKSTGIHSQDVTILKMRCAGHYASAIVHPKQPVTDDATVYLQKKKDWEVLSMGTDFDKDLLKKIPKSIRTY